MTLEQATTLAEQKSASLKAICASRATAQGELTEASAFLWNNPEIEIEHRRRKSLPLSEADSVHTDQGLGVKQTFELGGQQTARQKVAKAEFEALTNTIEELRRDVRTRTEIQFIEALSAQERLHISESALNLLQRSAELVGKRVQVGEDSRIDGNVATVELERATNQHAQLQELLAQARSDLAVTLYINPEELPDISGEIDAIPPSYSLAQLLKSAIKHPKLKALEAKTVAAHHQLTLERGAVYPDLTVGLSYSPEQGPDGLERITTLSVSLPLPLFRNNAHGIGQAITTLNHAETELQTEEQTTHAAVLTLWQRLQSLGMRTQRLQQSIIPPLEENQTLSMKALRAGDIGLSQFLLVRRQWLESQLELVDTRMDKRTTRIALEAAAGWPEKLPATGCTSSLSP